MKRGELIKMKKYLFTLFFISITFFACEEESINEPTPPPPSSSEHIIYNVHADTGSLNMATYFRFSDSTIVTGDDTASANWDIAFKATTILTNSGSSGPGQGGAIVLTGVNFSDVTTAPDTGYQIDQPGAPAIPTGSGNGWYNYDFATNIISPIPGVVLVIKTGDGKYAKVQILSYYKDAPQNPTGNEPSRYYTFKYLYQPDGSKNLE